MNLDCFHGKGKFWLFQKFLLGYQSYFIHKSFRKWTWFWFFALIFFTKMKLLVKKLKRWSFSALDELTFTRILALKISYCGRPDYILKLMKMQVVRGCERHIHKWFLEVKKLTSKKCSKFLYKFKIGFWTLQGCRKVV